jgi:hypothetical protein
MKILSLIYEGLTERIATRSEDYPETFFAIIATMIAAGSSDSSLRNSSFLCHQSPSQ